jgi:hypothetical protein
MTLQQLSKVKDQTILGRQLVQYFNTGEGFFHRSHRKTTDRPVIEEIGKDESLGQTQHKTVAWLYKMGKSCVTSLRDSDARTAYNTGILAADGWPQDIVADLFNAAAVVGVLFSFDAHDQLISTYIQLDSGDVDPDIGLQKAISQFACLCGKRELVLRLMPLVQLISVFTFRDMEVGEDRATLLDGLRSYIPTCRQGLLEIPIDHPRGEEIQNMLTTIDVYEAEVICQMEDWQGLANLINVRVVFHKIWRADDAGHSTKSRCCPGTNGISSPGSDCRFAAGL